MNDRNVQDVRIEMDFSIEDVSAKDAIAIINIFNHYVENSFAAYPENKVSYEFFELFLKMAESYPFLAAKDLAGKVLGFAMLRPHNPISCFSKTAEITCFIAPEYTGKGIGKEMLRHLLAKAAEKKISSILASISSLNPDSLTFHEKQGFRECGRFLKVGQKWGKDFDVVWMQRSV